MIEPILQAYFDGLYEGDVVKLATAFHEHCHLTWLDGGEVKSISRAEWFARVQARPAPARQQHPRADRIVSITRVSPTVAIAHVECALHPRHFTDALTLLLTGEGWRIVSKSYSGA